MRSGRSGVHIDEFDSFLYIKNRRKHTIFNRKWLALPMIQCYRVYATKGNK